MCTSVFHTLNIAIQGGLFMFERFHRSCWLEISLDHIKNNFNSIQEMAGKNVTVMPAVKANAYGHGVLVPCKALEEAGAQILSVGSIDEGIHLREYGVQTKILIFASNLIEEVADLYVKYNLTPTIMYKFQAEAISKAAGKEYGVFVKIETGRGRLGVNAEEAGALVRDISALPNIRVDGIYSHFAYTGWDEAKKAYPLWQFERFTKALDEIESYGIHIPFAQLVNTPGGIAYPDLRLTGMCPGRGIWGFSPLERRAGHPNLELAFTAWKSRLLNVKEVIGGKFGPNCEAIRLEKARRIGIVCGGASDGISRKHPKGGEVLIHGKRVPVCCSMSLEHMTVDLTNCPEAQPGDEVVIMGKQGNEEITQDELMQLWGISIPYFWTSIPEHVERLYFENGKAVAVARGYEVETI